MSILVGGSAPVFGVLCAWGFVDRSSFYDQIAHFPPIKRHLLHDVHAFQLGLGAALLLALCRLGGRIVALWSVSTAAVANALSHISTVSSADARPIRLRSRWSLLRLSFATTVATRQETK
jgi:hypothetical protein